MAKCFPSFSYPLFVFANIGRIFLSVQNYFPTTKFEKWFGTK